MPCDGGTINGHAGSSRTRCAKLQHRVGTTQLPAKLKLHRLTEKYLLRKLGARWLPQEIWGRRKRPYRAPIHRSFFSQPHLDYVQELLSTPGLKRSGLFKPGAVGQLVCKIEDGKPLGETDDM